MLENGRAPSRENANVCLEAARTILDPIMYLPSDDGQYIYQLANVATELGDNNNGLQYVASSAGRNEGTKVILTQTANVPFCPKLLKKIWAIG